MKRAYYSEKMAECAGTVFYLRSDGTEVECTFVSENGRDAAKWDDLYDLGEVEKYSCRGREGRLNKLLSFIY